ncbi:hypothetical protein FE772_00745 [Lysobacter enzymogenes]|nr:hypothetical protein [Lysobacter enzymogenes]QCW24412.1 hypothetical protein FE772_00745 [Lysobacter enzymogenes]
MTIRLAVLALLAFSLNATAQTSLTVEQRAEVAKMISEARAEVRREVLTEVCKELGANRVNIASCALPLASSADLERSLFSSPLHAQNDKKESGIAYSESAVFGTTPPPLLSGGADNGGNKLRFELSASDKNSKAALQLSRTGSGVVKGTERSFKSLSITASAPLNKDGGATSLGTLDGFANAFELSLRASRLVVTGMRTPLLPDGTPTKQMADMFLAVGLDTNKDNDLGVIKDRLRELGKLHLYPDFEALYWDPNAPRVTYGGFAKIGSENFDFIKNGTISSETQHEVPWSIGLFGGIVPRASHDMYFGAEISYERAFKAADSRTICPPISGTVLECVTGNYGSPSEQEKVLGSLEVRKAFGKMGAALKITHDFRSHDTGADAPIYLARSISGGFSSGLRLGWTSKDQFSVGVFIGSEFQFDQPD